jgi:hypothetical protein
MTKEETFFEEVRGPESIDRVFECIPPKMREALSAFDSQNCGADDHCGLFVVRRHGVVTGVLPRFLRVGTLPVRIGEKVVGRFTVRSALIPASAHHAFSEPQDAVMLLAHLRSAQSGLALQFPDLFTDTPLFDAVMQGRDLGYWVAGASPTKHQFHRFVQSYDAFFQAKRSKYKNQLRKKEKVFRNRVGLRFSLEEYQTAEEVSRFLAAADQINKKSYQYNLFGESIGDDTQNTKKYKKHSQRGEFRSFVLWHEDTPLCFVLGLQKSNGVFNHIMTGFDPEWRDYAPGINCNIRMLQRLYEEDRPRLLDFGSGDADYKRLFSNESRLSCSPMLIPDSIGYSIVYGIYKYTAKANQATVNLLERWGLKDKIKRVLRRQASR